MFPILDTTGTALVNRSSTTINVYGDLGPSQGHAGGITVAGKPIGVIYPNEFYIAFPDKDSMYITVRAIKFQNPSGKEANGYIEPYIGVTAGYYAWAQYQEPFHYYNSNGSSLVHAKTHSWMGKTYYEFTVKEPVGYRNRNGVYLGKLSAGTKIATLASQIGQTYKNHMIFYRKNISGSWGSLVNDSSGYGFVDLSFNLGSFPSNRAIW